jgi:hypothetical protein
MTMQRLHSLLVATACRQHATVLRLTRIYHNPVLNTENGYEYLPGHPTERNQVHHTDKVRRSAWRIVCAGLGSMPAERQEQTMNRNPSAVMLFESVCRPADWISPSVAAWSKNVPREQFCT